jgi:hypothetical protein
LGIGPEQPYREPILPIVTLSMPKLERMFLVCACTQAHSQAVSQSVLASQRQAQVQVQVSVGGKLMCGRRNLNPGS